MPDRLFAFQDKMTRFVDEGRAVDAISLDFSKAFNTISVYKLGCYGLDGYTTTRVNNLLDGQA